MEALRLAFDTIIVGALALPWLAIIVRIFFPGFASRKREETKGLLSLVPGQAPDAVAGILLVAIVYFAGLAVTRVADDFFDDAEIRYLPTESKIRDQVYCDEAKAGLIQEGEESKLWKDIGITVNQVCSPKAGDKKADFAEVFRVQESKVLVSGSDKIERQQHLHEQIVVLRGAALNGIIFSILCGFGFFAERKKTLEGHPLAVRLLPLIPASLLALLGLKALAEHLQKLPSLSKIYSEPPTMEGVIILLAVAGFAVVPLKEDTNMYRNGFFVGIILAILAYLGWWLTEVLYNQYVIHTIYALSSSAGH